MCGLLGIGGCAGVRPGDPLVRQGDEIVVAGLLFHTGTKVVLWTDAGGYDAYRVERRFAPLDMSDWESTLKAWAARGDMKSPTPNRYGMRAAGLSDADKERLRGGGWTLAELQDRVDQFVLHYDVCGTSRQCFNILHDHRDLSVHFMIDIDGTVYQTLDLKERAWHATISNDRSVGVEIANIGAYSIPAAGKKTPLDDWYFKDSDGLTAIRIPQSLQAGAPLGPGPWRPARNEPVFGVVQGMKMMQYDLTDAQYKALARLSATLCRVLPKIKANFPRATDGSVINKKLADADLAAYSGILGHYHIQSNKQDPGPAFDWDRLGREMHDELAR